MPLIKIELEPNVQKTVTGVKNFQVVTNYPVFWSFDGAFDETIAFVSNPYDKELGVGGKDITFMSQHPCRVVAEV